MDIRVGVGEELAVQLIDEVPMVHVPRAALEAVITAMSDDLHLRPERIRAAVRELRQQLN
jgi:hypothetical protein